MAGQAGFLAGLGIIASAVSIDLLSGVRRSGSPVVDHLRKWMGSWSRWEWFLNLVGVLTVSLFVIFAGLWPGLLVGILLGLVFGLIKERMVVVPGWATQSPPLAKAERFIRNLRLSGTDEDGLRLFIARYSGRGWQSLFETLFGYESLLQIRENLRNDSSFDDSVEIRSLRDRICDLLRRKTEEHQKMRDHQRLAIIEERGLEREGFSADEARDRAWQIAAAVMENTRVDAGSEMLTRSRNDQASIQKRVRMKQMIADARSGKYRRKRETAGSCPFRIGRANAIAGGRPVALLVRSVGEQSRTV